MGDKDVCYLTWECIADGMLIYERMKTRKQAKMVLTDKALNIINKYKDKSYGNFVFPILQGKHVTEKQKDARTPEVTEKDNEGQPVKSKAESMRNVKPQHIDNVPQVRSSVNACSPTVNFIADHVVIGRLGLYVKDESRPKRVKL